MEKTLNVKLKIFVITDLNSLMEIAKYLKIYRAILRLQKTSITTRYLLVEIFVKHLKNSMEIISNI